MVWARGTGSICLASRRGAPPACATAPAGRCGRCPRTSGRGTGLVARRNIGVADLANPLKIRRGVTGGSLADNVDPGLVVRAQRARHAPRAEDSLSPAPSLNQPQPPEDVRHTECAGHAAQQRHFPCPRATAKDPVCGMTVEPPTQAGSVEHDGTTYHFCSTELPREVRATSRTLYLGRRVCGRWFRGRGGRGRPRRIRESVPAVPDRRLHRRRRAAGRRRDRAVGDRSRSCGTSWPASSWSSASSSCWTCPAS